MSRYKRPNKSKTKRQNQSAKSIFSVQHCQQFFVPINKTGHFRWEAGMTGLIARRALAGRRFLNRNAVRFAAASGEKNVIIDLGPNDSGAQS